MPTSLGTRTRTERSHATRQRPHSRLSGKSQKAVARKPRPCRGSRVSSRCGWMHYLGPNWIVRAIGFCKPAQPAPVSGTFLKNREFARKTHRLTIIVSTKRIFPCRVGCGQSPQFLSSIRYVEALLYKAYIPENGILPGYGQIAPEMGFTQVLGRLFEKPGYSAGIPAGC